MTCAEPEYTALQEFLGLLDEIESDPNSRSGEVSLDATYL